MASDSPPSRRDRAGLAVAAVTVALGVFVLIGSFSVDLGAGYDRIGPRFFPWLVAVGLVVSGGLFAREASKSGPAEVSELSRPALVIAGAALVFSVLLLERAGFIVTATLLFTLVARAFESRRPVRDVLVGLGLSVVVYFAFTLGLGLALPRGF